MKLTTSKIRLLKPGTVVGDGRNLWLVSGHTGRKRWEFRFTVGGQRRSMGLGPWPEVSLDEARDKALANRKLLREGIDPLAEKAVTRPKRATTFQEMAEDAIGKFAKAWTGPKQEPQWRSSLARYAYPIIGKMPLASITAEHVRDVLEPIWTDKAPTAERVQNRIERILDYATVLKLRSGDNPARLKGNLEYLLGGKEVTGKHFPALPHQEIVPFLTQLRAMAGVAPRALEFLILTATRTNETTNACWSEIDFDSGIWTIPVERMKGGKGAHRIPLSEQALALLKALPRDQRGDFVFIGAQASRPVVADLRRVLVRMERTDITTHGFRSTFRDWVAERTTYADALAEKALAHKDSNKIQAAYRRTDMLEKRVPMMQEWANYCDGGIRGDNVVPLRGAQ